jgi:hypothetical protein
MEETKVCCHWYSPITGDFSLNVIFEVSESEKEPSNEASDTVSALRSLGSIHELQTLHSHIHGSSKGAFNVMLTPLHT